MLGPHSPNRDTIPDMAVPILDVTKWWECPSCHKQHVTREHRPHVPMHPCSGLKGFLAPFVEVHSNAGIRRGTVRHLAVERGDYVNGELGLRSDGDGRVIMAVRTERADGSNDCHVFPAAATAATN